MKKSKLEKEFFDELRKVPIVQIAAEKIGVSRNSIYQWRKRDKNFAAKMDAAMAEGVALVNDMSESQLLTLIQERNYPAISFWLRHRNDNYKDKLEVTTKEDNDKMSPSQSKTVKEALKHANIIKSNSIKKITKKKAYE